MVRFFVKRRCIHPAPLPRVQGRGDKTMVPARYLLLGFVLAPCALAVRAQDSPSLPLGATETPAPGDSAAAVAGPIARADPERMSRHELGGPYPPAHGDLGS